MLIGPVLQGPAPSQVGPRLALSRHPGSPSCPPPALFRLFGSFSQEGLSPSSGFWVREKKQKSTPILSRRNTRKKNICLAAIAGKSGEASELEKEAPHSCSPEALLLPKALKEAGVSAPRPTAARSASCLFTSQASRLRGLGGTKARSEQQ